MAPDARPSGPDDAPLFRRREAGESTRDVPAESVATPGGGEAEPDGLPGPPWWYRPPWYRRRGVIPGLVGLAVVAVLGVVVWAFTVGSPEPAGRSAVVDGPTDSTAAPTSTAAAPATTTTIRIVPADAACIEALGIPEVAGPFTACTAEQYLRLQPSVAPGKPDLKSACTLKFMGPACTGITPSTTTVAATVTP